MRDVIPEITSKMFFQKDLVIILAGLFLVMVGFGITLPVLPFYINNLSQTQVVSSQNLWLHVGLITGIYPFMQFLFSPYLGSLSDRLGRRPLILCGLAGYSISMFLFSISGSILILYTFRLMAGISSAAFFIAASAYVADNTSVDKRGRGMSLLISVASLGVVAGPLIGNLFSQADITIGRFKLDKYSLPFSISAILVLLDWCFLYFSLKESYNSHHEKVIVINKKEKGSVFINFKSIKKSFLLLLFLSFISQLSLAMFEGTFALHSQRLFQFGVKQMGLVFIVCGSVMGLLQLGPVAWLIKWKGERALLPYGLLILGIGMSLLMLSSEIGFILFFVSVVAAGMAILTPCLASLVTIASGENYGTSLGIYSSVNSLGQMLGVVTGSVMMIWFDHLPYFIISVILFITAWVAVPRSKFKILQLENIKK